MEERDQTKKPRRIPFTYRRVYAAWCAVNAMLQGEDGAGDWPPTVDRKDLEGALDALNALLDKK